MLKHRPSRNATKDLSDSGV